MRYTLLFLLAVGFWSQLAHAYTFTPRVEVSRHGRAVSLENKTCTEQPADTYLRQRILNTAAAAWLHFGAPVWDLSTPQNREFVYGGGFYPLPKEVNPQVEGNASRLLAVGIKEDERILDPWIGSFWATVPEAQHYIHLQNKIWEVHQGAGWAEAWSAAFTSWVMCEAGIAQRDFPRNAWHWRYVDHALTEKSHLYRAEPVRGVPLPQPGDMLCADRAKKNIYHSPTDRTVGLSRPMHCDIVVKTDPKHEKIYVLGGNVLDSVTLTVAKLAHTGEGYTVQPTPQRPWFALLRLGTGGKASFAAAVSQAQGALHKQ